MKLSKNKNYKFPGYVVTDGQWLYFVKWDDVNAVVAVDDQPGIISGAKHFDDWRKADEVAKILGWKIKKVVV